AHYEGPNPPRDHAPYQAGPRRPWEYVWQGYCPTFEPSCASCHPCQYLQRRYHGKSVPAIVPSRTPTTWFSIGHVLQGRRKIISRAKRHVLGVMSLSEHLDVPRHQVSQDR